jgi:hypothetical protein
MTRKCNSCGEKYSRKNPERIRDVCEKCYAKMHERKRPATLGDVGIFKNQPCHGMPLKED